MRGRKEGEEYTGSTEDQRDGIRNITFLLQWNIQPNENSTNKQTNQPKPTHSFPLPI